ncbi:MAG: hypothetical protein FJ137_17675 [Deltaproteobacteria bacterium]|nr:hypothetical protein [Deltaproteobacteria bacterium]
MAVDTGATGSSSASAKVCTEFVRRDQWDVEKDVDPERVNRVGGTATLTYVVAVAPTAVVDSGRVISGQVAVSNPNDRQDVSVTVNDVASGDTCIVYTPMPVVIPAGSTARFDDACGFDSGAAGTSFAMAMWDVAGAFTPSGAATGMADFAFTVPTTRFFANITVVDSFAGVLGTVAAVHEPPFATASDTHTRDGTVPTWGRLLADNTVTNRETGQQATAQAAVCGSVRISARTIGFWQNKNGQALITGGASMRGVCRSGTSLRRFAPFGDRSSTTTCTQVASYVLNVIKAANESGSSMNAMLKAQMLVTALDVCFSDDDLNRVEPNRVAQPIPSMIALNDALGRIAAVALPKSGA